MVPIDSWLADAHNFRQVHGRPLVTLSYAQSLDGCISLRPGIPTALSGPEAMRLTHRLRAAHDAILVGIGTILADDPRLTVRLVEGRNPQPVVPPEASTLVTVPEATAAFSVVPDMVRLVPRVISCTSPPPAPAPRPNSSEAPLTFCIFA